MGSFLDEWLHTVEPVAMSCAPVPGYGTACDAEIPPNSDTRTVEAWAADPLDTSFFQWTTPATDGYGADLVSLYDFNTSISLVGRNSATFGAGTFPCDNAPVFASQNIPAGCVFPGTGHFSRLSLSDPNVWQAADHVYTALTSPDSTLPPAAFKSIPGSETTGALTRTTDQKVIRANRHAARKACMKYDENYKTNRNNKADPLQYDEFPFASTNEGAGVRW